MNANLDAKDLALLEHLQRDGRLTASELADRIHLSPSQCARRRQRLEDEGYITAYRAVVDSARIGAAVESFVQVTMAAHSRENAQDFVRLAERTPAIVSVWTLTGEADYMLRVFSADLAALNRLVQDTLLPHPAVARVQSQIVMARLKDNAPISP
ncbi:Lrp/AsnC family transcriptional regulator [Pontivivens insulae]|uniref:Leucine-responsive regulatory protein n=1 Tax=Pontivivens insulae TaxID=1639689 RepID=A0A2R8AEX2_9RHOB|nr:Lrp/AsnC family transcriptional regulator [Pontivivens insulae]RED12033.1 DNA-binding Lrp family transcriptional regulator [Pontivivens insulae]SPF30789.1 Leucine-responsive regulatory protein [Pontivivens insulae]